MNSTGYQCDSCDLSIQAVFAASHFLLVARSWLHTHGLKQSLVILVALFLRLRLFHDSVIQLKDPGSFEDKCSLILKAASSKLDYDSRKCQLLNYSMILWFNWRSQTLLKTDVHWSWKQRHQSLIMTRESVNSSGGKNLITSWITWNICTHKLFPKLSWFIFKLVPSQLEEVLKQVWSPEVSCCIFKQKRVYSVGRQKGQEDWAWFREDPSCLHLWHNSTTDVLNFFIWSVSCSELPFTAPFHSFPA